MSILAITTVELTGEYEIIWRHQPKNSNESTVININDAINKYNGGSRRQPSLTILRVNDSDSGDYIVEIRETGRNGSLSVAGPATVHVLSTAVSKSDYMAQGRIKVDCVC